jgi:hypothetical protein
MALRNFILNNFRWKLTALTLATVVWFIIQFAIAKGLKPRNHSLTDLDSDTFSSQPVMVLKEPGDPATYKVTPARAEVTLRFASGILNKFSSDDIKVFVLVSGMRETAKETKPVFIYAPDHSQIIETRVEPTVVTVERILPAQK